MRAPRNANEISWEPVVNRQPFGNFHEFFGVIWKLLGHSDVSLEGLTEMLRTDLKSPRGLL